MERKINGKPSDFLYYLLESIKLEEKDNKEKRLRQHYEILIIKLQSTGKMALKQFAILKNKVICKLSLVQQCLQTQMFKQHGKWRGVNHYRSLNNNLKC